MDENKDEKVKSPALPLDGVKVLDLTQAMMGALTAMMLGDMGADVIKVERIQGEAIRKGRPSAKRPDSSGSRSSGKTGFVATPALHMKSSSLILR